MIHEELSGAIIGAAIDVVNTLKTGLDERLYERALTIELRHRGHSVDTQCSFAVEYRGELIGTLIPRFDRRQFGDRRFKGCLSVQ